MQSHMPYMWLRHATKKKGKKERKKRNINNLTKSNSFENILINLIGIYKYIVHNLDRKYCLTIKIK